MKNVDVQVIYHACCNSVMASMNCRLASLLDIPGAEDLVPKEKLELYETLTDSQKPQLLVNVNVGDLKPLAKAAVEAMLANQAEPEPPSE